MKNLLLAVLVVAVLTAAGGASADPLRYGVADDWPKFHPCGDVWWTSATDIGYQDLRMTVQWNATTPTTIPFQANLQAAIDCAQLNNIRPILAIYPAKPSAIGSNATAQAQFATFVSLVGQAFPGVKDIIVGNEPNVNRFWQPQYTGGKDAAATDYEHTLAQAYDALKAVRPDAVVWGPSISSRGNDNATATSNPSHSPVWFIKYMGDAYRASGRTKPIFDEFNMHPYPPVQDTAPFTKSFQWPQAGAANLDRVKQALWDAFNGTGQPVPAEQPGGKTTQFAAQGLPIDLDEAGQQTVVTGHEAAYDGTAENVTPISEAAQAQSHVDLAEIAACDSDVKAVLYFPLIDDTGISTGFQSGNLFADLTKKASYDAMKAKIAAAKGSCQGGVAGIPRTWVHATDVIGAQAVFGEPGPATGALKTLSARVTATEDATYTAWIQRVSGGPASRKVTGRVAAYHNLAPRITGLRLSAGTYRFEIVLEASVNPARTTTLTSPPFTILPRSTGTRAKCKQGLGRGKHVRRCAKK